MSLVLSATTEDRQWLHTCFALGCAVLIAGQCAVNASWLLIPALVLLVHTSTCAMAMSHPGTAGGRSATLDCSPPGVHDNITAAAAAGSSVCLHRRSMCASTLISTGQAATADHFDELGHPAVHALRCLAHAKRVALPPRYDDRELFRFLQATIDALPSTPCVAPIEHERGTY